MDDVADHRSDFRLCGHAPARARAALDSGGRRLRRRGVLRHELRGPAAVDARRFSKNGFLRLQHEYGRNVAFRPDHRVVCTTLSGSQPLRLIRRFASLGYAGYSAHSMTSPPDLFAREQREVFSPSALVRMARDVLEDAFPLIW